MVSSNSTGILTHVQTNSEPLDQGVLLFGFFLNLNTLIKQFFGNKT